MTDDDPTYGDVANMFAGIARTLFVDTTVAGTLQRVVDFAQAKIMGCDAASISLITADGVMTPVSSIPSRSRSTAISPNFKKVSASTPLPKSRCCTPTT
jgi:hypothetical protein